MLYSEMKELSLFELKRELATRGAELDSTIQNLEQLPFHGTAGQRAQAAELMQQMEAQQQTVELLRKRLLELEPPAKPPAAFV